MDIQFGTVIVAIFSTIILGIVFWIVKKITSI